MARIQGLRFVPFRLKSSKFFAVFLLENFVAIVGIIGSGV